VKLPEQVTRLGIVIVSLLAVVLALRFLILPPEFFSAKPHQAAKVVREMAKQPHYAGVAACRKCHEEQFEAKYAGAHAGIGCENCHGPSLEHAANEKAPVPPKPREREFCLGCHAYQAARPDGFPQVDPSQHKPRKRCVSCHDPHDPVPPDPIADCTGCHGRIGHIKALSTHALLPCTECHKADEQHMVHPRQALPTKPTDREACGRCHSVETTDPAASKARVDLQQHGRSFVCWECHYAHLPEGPK
jgi:predicted CXXCH cytochrome family protein